MPNQSGFISVNTKSRANGLPRFSECERGATAIEYGLIAGLISIAISATLIIIGETLRDDWYQVIAGAVAAAAS